VIVELCICLGTTAMVSILNRIRSRTVIVVTARPITLAGTIIAKAAVISIAAVVAAVIAAVISVDAVATVLNPVATAMTHVVGIVPNVCLGF
jgi:hypothetical protein